MTSRTCSTCTSGPTMMPPRSLRLWATPSEPTTPAPLADQTMTGLAAPQSGPGQWTILLYRLPREPSTPPTAGWQKLKRLGVAQLAEGLAALPADARTREQLDWIADEVIDAGGTAGVWIAHPASTNQEHELARAMA